MPQKTYYQLFGVEPTASLDEIKKSYRLLAHKYHPDKHKGDPKYDKIFKNINHIYEVLTDEEKRSNYDYQLAQQTFHYQYTGSSKVSSDPFNPIWQQSQYHAPEPTRKTSRLSYNMRFTIKIIWWIIWLFIMILWYSRNFWR